MLDFFTTSSLDGSTQGYTSYPALWTFYDLVRSGVTEKDTVYLHPSLKHLEVEVVNFASWQLEREVNPSSTALTPPPNFKFVLPVFRPTSLVICCGAGIDSTIAVWWARQQYGYAKSDITVINIDYGAPYSRKERLAFQTLTPYLTSVVEQVGTVDVWPRLHMDTDKLPRGYIIPGRNALFATIGAMFGSVVWIVANYRQVDDEPGAALDKNRRFYLTVSTLLSRMLQMPRIVMSPVAHISKATSIAWFMSQVPNGLEILSKSTTCYDARSQRCGKCYACGKLAMTLGKLGLLGNPAFQFDVLPQDQPMFTEYQTRETAKGR